ncbi:baseplate wedge subunit [Acinetobacter phage Acj9]|uniref:Gp53 baseplate wedge subunit n=1 Tax=Acinetobacter phage Acj9 TaxID=760939 RepID=E5EPU3_9CAUD|nr:baseplate wedge subunit [Acinetobacter phage Acj9]ADG60059.1 gp53 baseplate wedge subunit [Acinetobacter phage Acj9]
MIISFYDPISYSAKTLDPNAKEILMANIFKNYTAYFKRVAANYNLVTHYIQGAPRPEALAYELYNNSQLYWVLTMANDIYDPFHDWIKSQDACYQSVAQFHKDPDAVAYHVDLKNEKYFNLVWYDDEPGVWYDKGDKNRLYPQYKGALAAVSLYEDALLQNEHKREIKIIAPSDIDRFISDLIKELENNSAFTG